MHINMLHIGLNDILDHKLIETNSFSPKKQAFSLQEVLKLIKEFTKSTSFEGSGFIDF